MKEFYRGVGLYWAEEESLADNLDGRFFLSCERT